MALSPFTFYRGSALNMAVDLATTPSTGLRVQCSGDAHLNNFRGFATPERREIFAINDLDETLPAPWEWDLKRLAASFVIASRNNGLSESVARDAVLTCAASYRERMAEFSELGGLELWYRAIDSDEIIAGIKDPALRRRAIKRLKKERKRTIAEDYFPKLASVERSGAVIKDVPPTTYHWEGHHPGEIDAVLAEAFRGYRESLPHSHRRLIDRYEIKDVAVKVVGVGSVGTACLVALLMGGTSDPLFLQFKEARASVLEGFAGKSVFPNHGQRVVNGHRLIQPSSDMLLGWTAGRGGRHFYVRQLRDVKIIMAVETFGRAEMIEFARWCGYSLALSHARSGDPVPIAGYLGKSDAFDQALASFSAAYADQNERDHAALTRAIKTGKIEAAA
jgi:uncharacterized protein (DUF2252 family)